jgi:predicted transposase YdaD
MESELFQELADTLKAKIREEGIAEGKAEVDYEFGKIAPLLVANKTIHEIAKETGIPLARVKAIKVIMKKALSL